MQDRHSIYALFLASEKAALRQPSLIFFLFVGDLRDFTTDVGRDEAATTVFVPVCWGFPRMQG